MKENPAETRRRLMAELVAVLADKANTAANDRVELRDAVCDYVALEHARGTPMMNVIETVKEILRNAEREAAHESPELARQLVDWCLEFHPGIGCTQPPKLQLLQ
jgi:hypothetical protein